jgi:hypothetical protein
MQPPDNASQVAKQIQVTPRSQFDSTLIHC